jgi:hypothetical protein
LLNILVQNSDPLIVVRQTICGSPFQKICDVNACSETGDHQRERATMTDYRPLIVDIGMESSSWMRMDLRGNMQASATQMTHQLLHCATRDLKKVSISNLIWSIRLYDLLVPMVAASEP